MIWLVLGLLLWSLSHLCKRITPGWREGMGKAGKGLVAAGVLGGLVLMILGYRAAPFVNVWFPPAWTVHLNNLLMFVSILLFGAGSSKSRLRGRLRHPMLLGVLAWSLSHLLVNGDLASIVLFGGLAVWAIIEIAAINVKEPGWVPVKGGSPAGDARLVGIAIILYAVIVALHGWLGPWPLPR